MTMVRRERARGNGAVKVRMQKQVLSPGVQDADKADLGTQVFRIGGDFQQGMRSLAEPLFPVWLEMFSLKPTKVQGYPTFAGFRRYGRLIRGTVNTLEHAWAATLQPTIANGDNAADS